MNSIRDKGGLKRVRDVFLLLSLSLPPSRLLMMLSY